MHALTSCLSGGAAVLSAPSFTALRFAAMLALSTNSHIDPRAREAENSRRGLRAPPRSWRKGSRSCKPRNGFRNCGEVRRSAAGLSLYLSPEPLLQVPYEVENQARSGRTLPTYAYGFNNPIAYADRDGRLPVCTVQGVIDEIIREVSEYSPRELVCHLCARAVAEAIECALGGNRNRDQKCDCIDAAQRTLCANAEKAGCPQTPTGPCKQ